MKYHVHSEQFDGALHAGCCRFPHDPFPGEKFSSYILTSVSDFAKLPAKKRCKYCEIDHFPYGLPNWLQ